MHRVLELVAKHRELTLVADRLRQELEAAKRDLGGVETEILASAGEAPTRRVPVPVPEKVQMKSSTKAANVEDIIRKHGKAGVRMAEMLAEMRASEPTSRPS